VFRLTVKIAPTTISPKLNDCCVVLAAFSIGERLPHGTRPSSLNAVTAFLLGCGAELEVPNPVWVAYSRTAINGRIEDGSDKSGAARVTDNMAKLCVAEFNVYLVVF
jgi:hypothetical protein